MFADTDRQCGSVNVGEQFQILSNDPDNTNTVYFLGPDSGNYLNVRQSPANAILFTFNSLCELYGASGANVDKRRESSSAPGLFIS